jgi:hypothetical protein
VQFNLSYRSTCYRWEGTRQRKGKEKRASAEPVSCFDREEELAPKSNSEEIQLNGDNTSVQNRIGSAHYLLPVGSNFPSKSTKNQTVTLSTYNNQAAERATLNELTDKQTRSRLSTINNRHVTSSVVVLIKANRVTKQTDDDK